MCKGCENKTWECWIVACAELSEKLDRLDYELERSDK